MPDRKKRRSAGAGAPKRGAAPKRAGRKRRKAPLKARPPRALMTVDVGNSETVVGWFRGRELDGFWRLTSGRQTADEIEIVLQGLLRSRLSHSARSGAVLCSVVPALTLPWTEALARLSGGPPVEVSAETAKTLPIRYHDRSAVGADRIANAIAARGLYGTPAIVVDLGTATTFDCISKGGAYLGGVIAPGVG